jgi:hypothetical protein
MNIFEDVLTMEQFHVKRKELSEKFNDHCESLSYDDYAKIVNYKLLSTGQIKCFRTFRLSSYEIACSLVEFNLWEKDDDATMFFKEDALRLRETLKVKFFFIPSHIESIVYNYNESCIPFCLLDIYHNNRKEYLLKN